MRHANATGTTRRYARRAMNRLLPPMRRTGPNLLEVRAVVATTALVLLALLGSGCQEDQAAEEIVIRPVLVHPVAPGSAVHENSFPARAKAGTESVLSFKVAGQVRDVLVSVGETVRQGQLIAALDDRDLRLELRQAEAGYEEARARDRNARAEFERTKILHEKGAASDNARESAETEAVSARAHLRAQAQAVALAKSTLGYAELRAPTDGLIASVDAEKNENVGVGTPIATLNAGGRAEVAFSVPESLIASIERGQAATVRFTTLPDAVFPAEIVEIGVGSGRTAFPVTARLLDADDRIRSGMVAEATIRFARSAQEGPPRLVVPAYAVAEDGQGRFVYVAKPSGDALALTERRAVATGSLTVEGLEIESGLEAGDEVVIAGLRFLEPGLTVRVMYRE